MIYEFAITARLTSEEPAPRPQEQPAAADQIPSPAPEREDEEASGGLLVTRNSKTDNFMLKRWDWNTHRYLAISILTREQAQSVRTQLEVLLEGTDGHD